MEKELVHNALRNVVDPCSIATGVPIDIVDMGIVRDVHVSADCILVVLRLTNPFCFQAALICEAILNSLGQVTGKRIEVEVDPTDDWSPEMIAPSARARLRSLRPLRLAPNNG